MVKFFLCKLFAYLSTLSQGQSDSVQCAQIRNLFIMKNCELIFIIRPKVRNFS